MTDFTDIMMFTDGACSGNPGRGGWGTIICTPEGHVREMGGGADETTNNRMEMAAVIRGLDALKGTKGAVAVYTDSVYVIRGITQWIFGWRRNGWKNSSGAEVANRDLWAQLADAVASRPPNSISWHYVRGHSNIPGNERVDEIAVMFTKGKRIDLYDGPLLRYEVALHDLPDDTSVPETSSKNRQKKAAHSYLSLINGQAMRHQTWADCERRVKGRSGAKFKKSTSESDEAEILASWGVDPSSVG